MAIRPLAEIRGLEDPLKQSQVEFIISDVLALKMSNAVQGLVGKISGNEKTVDGEVLRLRCRSFSYPGPKIHTTELCIKNHIRHIGTRQDKSGIWKTRITEDMEGGVLNTIQAWMDLIHSNITGIRLPSSLYVGSAQIIIGGDVHKPNGKKLEKRTIWLKGVYPIAYEVGTINPSSSEPVEVDVSWNYDYWADNSYSVMGLFN